MGAKLIRDKAKDIPWWDEDAKKLIRRIDDREEYGRLLLGKLFEELGELVGSATPEESDEERADVYQVMKALVYHYEGDIAFMTIVNQKFDERGGYYEGWVWDRHKYIPESPIPPGSIDAPAVDGAARPT